MLRLLAQCVQWIFQKVFGGAAPSDSTSSFVVTVKIQRHSIEHENPPPLCWTSCHPKTMSRYKATMACSDGHVFTLDGHSVSEDGTLSPSVVCPIAACKFHAYVRLDGWCYGPL